MDYGDLFASTEAKSKPKATRFQPKHKGKIKAEPAPSKGIDPSADGNAEEPREDPMDTAKNVGEEPRADPMEVDNKDGEEDTVVREIDVFSTPYPLDEDTLLYVMQHPMRPSWRPYELNERCDEVRLKPKQSQLEIDLSVDVHTENYNKEADLLSMHKQTITSSKASTSTEYGVGIMIGNQLHLNPVHAVLQLRPSPKHGKVLKKHDVRDVGASTKREGESRGASSKSSIKQGKPLPEDSNENIDDEPWIPLEYHAAESVLSGRYQQKMVSEGDYHIQFTMKPSDYVNSLCPRRSTNSKIFKGPSRRVLLSMPLEERMRKWFSEVSQVNRFVALMHLAPTDSKEDVLKVVQQCADLVQGLWVSKSSLLYEGREARVRDYILFLFSESRVLHKDKLKQLKAHDDTLKRILSPLAVERTVFNDWKFKEAKDSSFETQHPDIVKEQERSWSQCAKIVMNSLHGAGVAVVTKNSLIPNLAKRATALGKVDQALNKGKDAPVISVTAIKPNESGEALRPALMQLFHLHKVCSLNSIARGLREMALQKSRLWKGHEPTALVNAANGVSAPSSELKSVLSILAVNIHGVYVLKSMGNPVLDPLREIVIAHLLERGPNAKLEKKDIERAAQISLKRDIPDSEYNQVLNELCVHVKGAWVLKSVD